MALSNAVRGLDVAYSNKDEPTCAGCVLGKGHRQAILKKSHSRETKLLELFHSGVNAPLEVSSPGGFRLFRQIHR